MKKLKIFFILPICVLFSCSEDDGEVNNYNLGANVILNTSSISNLDVNHTMEMSIITASDVTVTGMKVSKKSNTVDASISKDMATFNSSILGTLAGNEKDGITFNVASTLSNSKPYSKDFTVKIKKALSLEKPLEAIIYDSSVPDTLEYKVTTKSAVVDNVSLEWKKGLKGTYAPTTTLGTDLDVKGEKIIFTNFTDASYGYNLAVKDTLYLRFVATSGTLTDSLETFVPIIGQTFENGSKLVLSSDLTKNKLNLDTATSHEDSNTDDGEIKFKSPNGFEKEGSTAIDFVKVGDLSGESENYNSVDKLFAEKDLLIAQKLYDAGTKETEFSDVASGDLYVYKITREDDDEAITEYGMIKIGDIVTTTGETNLTEVNIEFGEAEIK